MHIVSTVLFRAARKALAFGVMASLIALTACGGGSDGDDDSFDGAWPFVLSFTPFDNTTAVSVNTSIVVVFSEPMNESSLDGSLTLSGPQGAVAGTSTITSTTLTFQPATPLELSTTYTAALSVQPKDLAGNPLSAAMSRTFTTDSVVTYMVGGTVSGLTEAYGAGPLELAIYVETEAGGQTRSMTLSTNGAFTFTQGVPVGASYAVYAQQNPATQHCVVENSGGTITNAHVTNVTVTCQDGFAPTRTVGGSVSGLPELDSVGLSLSYVGPSGGTNEQGLSVDTNGPFAFSAAVEAGKLYRVSVGTQPETADCAVENGLGTTAGADVTNVNVTCVPRYPLLITVSGLDGFDSVGVTLSIDGVERLEGISQDGEWTLYGGYALPGAVYALTVYSQPAHATCTPGGGSNGDGTGTMTASAAQLTLTCAPNLYTISGTVSGLVGSGLQLVDALGGSVSVGAAATSFVLPQGLIYQDTYSVTVQTQPGEPAQHCSVSGGEGSVEGDVTTIHVTCRSVQPVYPLLGSNWNQWVATTGATLFDSDDSECMAGSRCLHGGELRKVATAASSCAGLSASDALGSFDWSCDASSGKAVFYGALKANARLSDLLDFSTPGWLANSVTIGGYTGASLGGQAANQTPEELWWSNPVVVANEGASNLGLWASGTIYVVTAPAAGSTYEFTSNASGIALVIKPGVTLDGDIKAGNTATNLWLEGTLHRTTSNQNSNLVHFNSAANTVLRHVALSAAGQGSCGGMGVNIQGGNNNRLEEVSVSSCGSGLYLSGNSNARLRGITASGNTLEGVHLTSATNLVAEDIVATGNGRWGINIQDSTDVRVLDVTAIHNDSHGIRFNGGVTGLATGLSAFANGESGIYVTPTGGGALRLVDVSVAENSLRGLHVNGTGYSSKVVVQNMKASNNGDHGAYLQAANVNASNVLAVGNASDGVRVWSTSAAMAVHLNGVTAVNSGMSGVRLSNSAGGEGIVASGLLAANNGEHGVNINGVVSSVDIRDVVAVNNAQRGIAQASSNDVLFTGLVTVGNNGAGDCSNGSTGTGLANVTCAAQGSSSITLSTGKSASGAFVGMTGADSANQSDTDGHFSGFPSDRAAFDWLAFENPCRLWGRHSANAFPHADQRGRWGYGDSGADGHIWDWSLGFGRTLAWARHDPPLHGNDTRTSSTLNHAWELVGDGVGDDDGLCEGEEVCLYTPNIGAYQGHLDMIEPELISAGSFTNGALTDIVVLRYGTNGYWVGPPVVEVPSGWTCHPDYYGTDDGCDCGCGEVDLDCADATVASCNYCNGTGSCSAGHNCPGLIDPTNNAICTP